MVTFYNITLSTAFSLLMLSSASGMPQHWQISSLGEPSNVLMDTSNSLDSRFNVSGFGIVSPVSLN